MPRKCCRNDSLRPSCNLVNRDARGIGGNNTCGLARSINPRHQRAFRLQIFDNGFDDAVRLCDQIKIVFQVSDADAFGDLWE